MTHDRSVPLASAGDLMVSTGDFLRGLHRRGRLLPLLREALAEAAVARAAADAGLAVADADLQQAADRFRRCADLTSADETHAWLARQGWSVADLEAAAARDLLLARWKDHLAAGGAEARFRADQAGFDRLRVRRLVVDSEALARELLAQIHEEGRPFAVVAEEHAPPAAPPQVVYRRQLPSAMAAAVASAAAGDVIGPLPTATGFLLLLLEEVQPATLDAATRAAIREELFQAWLAERLPLDALAFPVLDGLGG